MERLRAAGCVFAEEEAALLIREATARHPDAGPGGSGDARAATLTAMTAARVAGEPLETVLGWVAFAGRRIIVRPGVFVPRRRTEQLAGAAVEAAAQATRRTGHAVVVDMCCGSGAIGAVVADEVPGAVLHAADVDPAAVACAAENLVPRGAAVHRGDLMVALPPELRGRIDVLVANVPYVPRVGLALMPPEARLHEPEVTRDGGEDGLDVLRRVAAEGREWLAPTGTVLVEVADAQVTGALQAMRAAGLVARTEDAEAEVEDDQTRVVSGRPAG
ncbi:putative protein N(5)-glutamine methyltransferase [Clavibacter sepedonicus]|uniref:putative protein N(5)-glutamine methyltransferase n=1 Tax=Clavibacter sepedonicus TaxID=31964 RepID=UPI003DA45389